ncbi:hypothetical protein [uncultured Shewanella sp.]|uniref:hypothetical protein n=1 Tax=uncultured Shewanella sp. TaxID=173975 RepID=UPI00260CE052|nr:hypothetical protein [uncultured Shewanella sp.]
MKLPYSLASRVAVFVVFTLMSANALSAVDNIVINWPAKTSGSINPILVYELQILEEAKKSSADIKPAAYVTAIPAQSGVPTPVPAPVSFFYAENQTMLYDIYVSQSSTVSKSTTWKHCQLSLVNGQVVSGQTTCGGATKTDNSTSTVGVYSFGTNFVTTIAKPPKGYMNYLWNVAPSRSVTIKNSTGNKICFNMSSKFNKSQCTGTGDIRIDNGSQHVITVSEVGAMSHVGFITGSYDDSIWTYSGNMPKVGVYATALEWSIFPSKSVGSSEAGKTDHTIGMTNVDLSAVNGYNFAATLSVASDSICSTAMRDSAGNAQPAKYAVYSGVIAELPTSGIILKNQCPRDSLVSNLSDFKGCLSPCKLTIKNGRSTDFQNKVCCQGSTYGSSTACTAATIDWNGKSLKHDKLPYVKNLASPNTENVYRWQFDDYVGDFSCQPETSLVYTIYSANSSR